MHGELEHHMGGSKERAYITLRNVSIVGIPRDLEVYRADTSSHRLFLLWLGCTTGYVALCCKAMGHAKQ